MLNNDELEKLAGVYKLFGSVSRLRILILLLTKGEQVASELAEFSQISQPAASHQLKDLKNSRIIKSRKEGLNVIYSLEDQHISEMLMNGIEHMYGEQCFK
jgi:ArsR family transcriptional regulator